MSAAHWAVGMTKLGEGFYTDRDGALHIDWQGVCRGAGVAYTPANVLMLEGALAELIARYFPSHPPQVEHLD